MAPTGVAAININGTTIHTALAIPKESGDNLPPLSDQKRTQIRIALSDLKLVIIDKISVKHYFAAHPPTPKRNICHTKQPTVCRT